MTEVTTGHRASPVEIRAEFERLVVDDLYGPAGGPDEQLADLSPSDRYLVGILAPVRTPAAVDASRADADEPAVTGDDAPLDAPAARPALYPSSKGLSFAVPAELNSVTVTCSWGKYHREEVSAAAEGDAQPEPAAEVRPTSPARSRPAVGSPVRPSAPGAPRSAATGGGTVRVWQRVECREAVDVALPQ